MCVVSMISDHYYDKWRRLVPEPYEVPQPYRPVNPWLPTPSVKPTVPPISDEEIEEFRRLLERAREYDRANNEPDCEMEEKKRRLKELADLLGVDISFVDEPAGGKT
jgi:hypothetical protein